MTSTKRVLASSALVASLLLGLAVPAGATPEAPNVHPWLLTISDMPSDVLAGWSTSPTSSPIRHGCWGPAVELLSEHPGSSGSVGFQSGNHEGGEDLFSWSTASAARHAWSLTTTGLNRCHQYSTTDSGTRVVFDIETLSLGKYGNASAAYELTFTLRGDSFGVDYLLALKGRAVAELYYSELAVLLHVYLQFDVVPLFQKAMARVSG